LGPNIFGFKPLLTCGGILLTGKVIASQKNLSLLNVYGSCSDRHAFWDLVVVSGLLSLENLILSGYLNITLSTDEVWGGTNSVGSLADYYKLLLQSKNLVDLRPDKVVPTWRNGRKGVQAIAKRLDKCIVFEGLLSECGLYRTWVEYPFISDHAHIVLQLDISSKYRPYPFKLNPLWLVEEDYKKIVYQVWRDPKFNSEGGCQSRLIWNLKELKRNTKDWVKRRDKNIILRMESLESQIRDTFLSFVDDYSQSEK
jgi:hypothetical protein